jgi:DNA-binding transcriptional LysR family regulator
MPARINLDLDTLRTLVVANDVGGLGQAAEQLGRTPSAISLQMKRLQDDLGIAIFHKNGRKLALTEAGVVVLDYARRILTLNDELLDSMQGANLAGKIRVGCPQDFASILPPSLAHFSSLYPKMQVEVRIEGNAALADAIEASQLDLAIVIGQENRAATQVIGHLDVVWIASSAFVLPGDQAVPLASLGPQCAFRKRAIEALEERGLTFRIAASSPSLDGLWAALLGGLGVTARTALNLPEGLVSSSSLHGLPAIEGFPVTLHRGAHSEGMAVDRMAMLLTEAVNLALLSSRGSKPLRNLRDISSARAGKHKARSTVG